MHLSSPLEPGVPQLPCQGAIRVHPTEPWKRPQVSKASAFRPSLPEMGSLTSGWTSIRQLASFLPKDSARNCVWALVHALAISVPTFGPQTLAAGVGGGVGLGAAFLALSSASSA